MYHTKVLIGEEGDDVLWEGKLPLIPRIGECFIINKEIYKNKKFWKYIIKYLRNCGDEKYSEQYLKNANAEDLYGMDIGNIIYNINADNSLTIEIYLINK